jgi:pyruvate formate lyase activating enzyme
MEARYYIRLDDQKVKCTLCPHQCIINEGGVGICKARDNNNGILETLNYGIFSAVNFDPIEKKPLYHFYPGSEILSFGAFGCNFHCPCCQNYEISQTDPVTFPRRMQFSIPEIMKMAKSHVGNIGIAFTYNEPTVWFEQMIDIAKESKSIGLKNVVVSNGFINSGPLKELLKYTDAFNIDIKMFDEVKHKKFTGGDLRPVLDNLIQICSSKKHLEITSLVVPGFNDSISEFNDFIGWVYNNLGKNTPLHISRYFPKYKMTEKATSQELILEMAKIASQMLNFVYVGNISGSDYQNTKCPKCTKIIAVREGCWLSVKNYGKNGECLFCGHNILIN